MSSFERQRLHWLSQNSIRRAFAKVAYKLTLSIFSWHRCRCVCWSTASLVVWCRLEPRTHDVLLPTSLVYALKIFVRPHPGSWIRQTAKKYRRSQSERWPPISHTYHTCFSDGYRNRTVPQIPQIRWRYAIPKTGKKWVRVSVLYRFRNTEYRKTVFLYFVIPL